MKSNLINGKNDQQALKRHHKQLPMDSSTGSADGFFPSNESEISAIACRNDQSKIQKKQPQFILLRMIELPN